MNSSISIDIDSKNQLASGGKGNITEQSKTTAIISSNNLSLSEVVSPIHASENNKSENESSIKTQASLNDCNSTKIVSLGKTESNNLSDTFILDQTKSSTTHLGGTESISELESDANEILNALVHDDINSSSVINGENNLHRHRCPSCDPERQEFLSRLNRDEARIHYNKGYSQLLFWILLLLSGWGITRLICIGEEFPGDCSTGNNYLETMQDIQQLFVYGFVQGFFIDIIDRKRFYYIFHRKRWWFFLLFYISGQIFALIGNNEMTASSLDASSSLTTFQIIMYATLAFVVFALMSFIVFHAYRIYPRHNFLTYIGSRFSVILFYGIYFILAAKENDIYHFHHYFIAWIISLFAQFQHPVPLALLAISSGIFVQGIGAYHADALFSSAPNDDYNHFYFQSANTIGKSFEENKIISQRNSSYSNSELYTSIFYSRYYSNGENITTF